MTRNRRRLLVAVLSLIALVVVWFWWNAPQIDERLVGQWSLHGTTHPPMELQRSGIVDNFAYEEGPSSVIAWGYPRRWSVKSGQLICIDGYPSLITSPGLFLRRMQSQLSGYAGEAFDIVEVGPESLKLRLPRTGHVSDYVRVGPPER
jgi:hypothetical protein